MSLIQRWRQVDQTRAFFAGAIVTSAVLTGGIVLVLALAGYVLIAK